MNRERDAERIHCVYRLYDAQDVCLYVGCTVDVEARLETHLLTMPFMHEVTRREVTAHAGMSAGQAVELAEIARLRPRRNIVGRPPRSIWTACDYFEVIERLVVAPDRYASGRKLWMLVDEYRRRFPDTAEQTLPCLRLDVLAVS